MIDWSFEEMIGLVFVVVPVLTLFIDNAWGEPPARLHPVVWMGHLLSALERLIPTSPPMKALCSGVLGWFVGALLTVTTAWLLQTIVIEQLPTLLPASVSPVLQCVLLSLLLKPLLSLRFLLEEVLAVEAALEQSLEAGRKRTARICSRNTDSLDATALRETAIESVSENLVDSVVAPLFWFAVAGLPGAALYRWANTADAMWGYRDDRREWMGKSAARIDDLLSWLPARLSVLLLWPAGQVRQLPGEASKTPSPNGGWPMAATAFCLGIRLEKPGSYVLNANGHGAVHGDIARATVLCRRAAWQSALALGVLVAAILTFSRALFTHAQ